MIPGDIPAGKRNADERAAHLIHHPPRASSDLLAAYPSHLHIDVLPRQQGQGLGGRLMQSLLDALRQAGSTGVHLVVSAGNPNAIGFYHHQGFRSAFVGRPDAAYRRAGQAVVTPHEPPAGGSDPAMARKRAKFLRRAGVQAVSATADSRGSSR